MGPFHLPVSCGDQDKYHSSFLQQAHHLHLIKVLKVQIEVQEEDAARPKNFHIKIQYAASVAMRDLYEFVECVPHASSYCFGAHLEQQTWLYS